MALREPGLDVHHLLRGAGRVGPAAEREDLLDVRDVGRADVGELVLAVVGLVGQAGAALHDVDQVAGGVPVVGVDVGAEEAAAAAALEAADELDQGGQVGQRRDLLEVGPDRLGTERLDPLLVHEAGEQVADLLRVRPGLVGALGELLDDRLDPLLGLVARAPRRPPRRACRRGSRRCRASGRSRAGRGRPGDGCRGPCPRGRRRESSRAPGYNRPVARGARRDRAGRGVSAGSAPSCRAPSAARGRRAPGRPPRPGTSCPPAGRPRRTPSSAAARPTARA